jgi:hypothetical protein
MYFDDSRKMCSRGGCQNDPQYASGIAHSKNQDSYSQPYDPPKRDPHQPPTKYDPPNSKLYYPYQPSTKNDPPNNKPYEPSSPPFYPNAYNFFPYYQG